MEKSFEELLQNNTDCMMRVELEVSSFRAEMKEFKKTVTERLSGLDSKTSMCQINPKTCSTARKLDEYIKEDRGKSGKTISIIGCVISCVTLALTLIIKLT